MPTDTTEKGLENIIIAALTGNANTATPDTGALPTVQDGRPTYQSGLYVSGASSDYDKEFALDRRQLFAFLEATQPAAF